MAVRDIDRQAESGEVIDQHHGDDCDPDEDIYEDKGDGHRGADNGEDHG